MCDVLLFRRAFRFFILPMSMTARRCVDVVDMFELPVECSVDESFVNAVASVVAR